MTAEMLTALAAVLAALLPFAHMRMTEWSLRKRVVELTKRVEALEEWRKS